MIYQIDDKYYVNISPNIYAEVELKLEKDDLVLVPTTRQREVNKTYEIKQIIFAQEKNKLKEKLLKEQAPKETPRKSFSSRLSSTTSKRW